MLVALSGQFAPDLKTRITGLCEVADLASVLETPQSELVMVLVTRGKLKVNAALLNKMPGLRKVVKAGSGLDTIDLTETSARGIEVIPTGGSAESVADLAVALLYSCLRNIPAFDHAVRKGDWQAKDRFVGNTVASRRVGIVGFGRIGQAFASMTRMLGARVVAWDRSIAAGKKLDTLRKLKVEASVSLPHLIKTCDVISLHLPLVSDTVSLIGRQELEAVNPGTILINTARAPIIERQALIDSLSDGSLAAAGLDVHYNEGNLAADPLFTLPNVVLTPHVGAQTHQAHQAIADRIVDEIHKTGLVTKEAVA